MDMTTSQPCRFLRCSSASLATYPSRLPNDLRRLSVRGIVNGQREDSRDVDYRSAGDGQ